MLGKTITFAGVGACGTGILAALPATHGISHFILRDPRQPGMGGMAYGVSTECFLLNETSERMSIRANDPNGFVKFTGGNSRAFESRATYGRYLRNEFEAKVNALGKSGVRVDALQSEICSLEDPRNSVLALGHQQKQCFVKLAQKLGEHFVGQPTDITAKAVPMDDPEFTVVCLGTSLGFVDVFNHLRSQGYQGRLLAVSPSGRLPPARDVNADWGKFDARLIPSAVPLNTTADQLNGLIRNEIARIQDETSLSEREIAGGLGIQGLCKRLSPEERQKFYSSHAGYYKTVMTPIPPEVRAAIDMALESGKLEVVKAKCLQENIHSHGGKAYLQDINEQVDIIVNCSGYASHVYDMDNPLLQHLAEEGIIVDNPDGGIAHVKNIAIGRDGSLGPYVVGTLSLEVARVPGVETFRQSFGEVASYIANDTAEATVREHIQNLALADVTTAISGEKGIGWLAAKTILKVTGQSAEEWASQNVASDARWFIRGETREHEEALFVYHPEKLQSVLDQHRNVLERRGVPVNAEAFAKNVSQNWHQHDDLEKVIAHAFADDTHTGEIVPLARPSAVDASVRGFNSAGLGEILAATKFGINPFEFMHPEIAKRWIDHAQKQELGVLTDLLGNHWHNQNLYLVRGAAREFYMNGGVNGVFRGFTQDRRTHPLQGAVVSG